MYFSFVTAFIILGCRRRFVVIETPLVFASSKGRFLSLFHMGSYVLILFYTDHSLCANVLTIDLTKEKTLTDELSKLGFNVKQNKEVSSFMSYSGQCPLQVLRYLLQRILL
jgi:hypothetical protein